MRPINIASVEGVRYVLLPYQNREKGSDPCAGCVGWNGTKYTPLCDQLPECAGGTWREDKTPLFTEKEQQTHAR